ncbi:AcrR family transcriptional regulator [Paenibacillus shirakamiensis]|uniref:AcrR family transcriptional regulator n=1 Tax=Paenibacillus shirakamiensis TaxID=1265935 RepID=A0ABS4JG90_9BACL|nr:TetR/AcrR family transcriptional regulator [Paenibacillus shirakamiensis]MBP2000116.1 AcrR family transcriptional regulator [Paenibacillus shirakamiensis]
MNKRTSLSREIVLKQGLKISSEQGFNQLTYNGLARSLSVQPQSLYRYAPNLENLKSGIVALYLQGLIELIYHELLAYSGKEALRRFAGCVISYSQSELRFPHMVGALTEFSHTEDVAQQVEKLHTILVQILTPITEDKSMIEQNEQLFLTYLLGHLQLMNNGIAPNKANIQQNFDRNIERLISLF